MRMLIFVALAVCPGWCLAEEPVTPVLLEHVARDVEGWTVQVDKQLLEGDAKTTGDQALKTLAGKLHHLVLMLPEDRLARLREVPIWLDLNHPLTSMQYHPGAGWLREHGYDPAMEKAVHIPRAHGLLDHDRNYDQPAAVLHELAHAYHDRVLTFEDPRILKVFALCAADGKLESVLHIDGRKRKHYALTNHKEFFAEMTEAYLQTNDFFPFVRGEVLETSPETAELLEEIWRKPAATDGQ